MLRVRNIEVLYKINTISFVTQLFVDWYDFADWLKQRQLAGEDVIIRSWHYSDRRV